MTTVIRRRRGLVLLSVVVGLVVSACSSGPSQVNAAAIVGGKTITVDRVQELVDAAVKAEPAAQVLADQRKLDLLSRAILRQMVLHELTDAYARKHSVAVDPGQVNQLATQLSQSLEPLPTDGTASPEVIVDQAVNRVFDPAELARDYLIRLKIGQQAAPTLAVTFDYVLVSPGGPDEPTGSLRGKAETLARSLAAGPDAAERIIRAEAAAGGQANLGEVFTPGGVGELAGSVLFGTEPGNVVGFQPSPENPAWVVAVIRERKTDAAPDESTPQDPRLASALGPRLLQPMVDEVGVKISPRYGVWDTAAMGVAPSEAESAGFVLPVGAAKP
ncbi:SurA N-terminal domain-containing protein [Actinokineospora sp. NPDC004072]